MVRLLTKTRAAIFGGKKQKLEKTIPDTPKNQIPVHLRTRQIFAHYPILRDPGQPRFGKSVDPPSVQAAAAAAQAQAQAQAQAPAS